MSSAWTVRDILQLAIPLILIVSGILVMVFSCCSLEFGKWLIALGVSIAGFSVGYTYARLASKT